MENAGAISRVISIVESKLADQPVIVVSAFSKVTDSLYRICDCAENGNTHQAKILMEQLRQRHLDTLAELTTGPIEATARTEINTLLDELEKLVAVICLLGELSDRSKARIIGTGEGLSSRIICAALHQKGIKTGFIEAKSMIITDNTYLKASPIPEELCQRVPREVARAMEGNQCVITQGFVSSTVAGVSTVLGRGGSDYTASLIGMALDAREIEIWTDVDGVFTADPKRVETSKSLEIISFEEATEMAHFGAKVLHPYTILPAVEKNIPVRVLNSKCPDHRGTLILHDAGIAEGVKALSFKEHITVVNIYSTSMINTFGFLEKVFEIFGRHHVSVDLISTSEANVSLTVEDGQTLQPVVEELAAFAKITVEHDKSQISVIGKNLINIKGLCTQIFGSLREYRIYMISQGASAINISFVVDRKRLWEIVNKLHQHLFDS